MLQPLLRQHNQALIRQLFAATRDLTGNLPPMPGIYPDYLAPVVCVIDGQRTLTKMRWGMPSSSKAIYEATAQRAGRLRDKGQEVNFDELLRKEPDSGTTNVRNTSSKQWQRWLEPKNRYPVPFTSFSEHGRSAKGNPEPVWFAANESRPLLAFAGIFVTGWTSVRRSRKARRPTTSTRS